MSYGGPGAAATKETATRIDVAASMPPQICTYHNH